jgi:SH3 domain-containing YSC84-like protein 1
MTTRREGDPGKAVSLSRVLIAIFFSVAIVAFVTAPLVADDRQDATQLVDKARLSLEGFMSDNNMGAFNDLVKQAKGVFIIPQMLKGAFIVGASGGSGVLLVYDDKTGHWNGPAFYTVGGASFGLQIGGAASEVILLAMTDRGVSSFLSNSLKLGADVGIAVGPVGGGVSAATANLSADILSFARSKGLYGGISLDGAIVAVRGDWNEAYYGQKTTPSGILVLGSATNPQTTELTEVVRKASGKK